MAFEKMVLWARRLKRDAVALWIAAQDARTPFGAKCVAAVVAAYALSPFDLIPDFLPVLGYLDDLILVPLGIMLVVRMIPPALMDEFRALAALREGKPKSLAGALAIIALWLLMLSLIAYFLIFRLQVGALF